MALQQSSVLDFRIAWYGQYQLETLL